ncbi:MAG: lamin tail domain-containing protein, partial [Verrucomicrobia bacterium]|nr:lamin tail domain-containing protein [Verrucomicrobiota bacterium]
MIALTTGVGVAAPVLIGDPSFESNNLAAGQWTTDLAPEWQTQTTGSAFEEYIAGFSAEGTDHLGMIAGAAVWQDLPATYQPNTRYTLTAAIGNRSGQTNPGNLSTYSLEDSTGTSYTSGSEDASVVAAGMFSEAMALVFETPGNPAAIGKTIRIRLYAGGVGRSHFDNIRLDATLLAPIGSATVENAPASTITGTVATLNGNVVDIGSDAPAVTVFYGMHDGGKTPESWTYSTTLPGTQSGPFSSSIIGLDPNSVYYFTARATNSSGTSWASPALSFSTPPAAPTVENLTATDVTGTTANIGASVASTGGITPTLTLYYGTTDGGTTPGDWQHSIALGAVETSAISALTSLAPSTTYYYRAFAENTGGGSWAATTASFGTLAVFPPTVANHLATSVTGVSATLNGEVVSTGNDTPFTTFYYGTSNGGTNPEAWDHFIDAGFHDSDFDAVARNLAPQTIHYYTTKATNIAGTSWAASSGTFTTSAQATPGLVINEIHFDEDDKTLQSEFIELHNAGDSPIDLSGYAFVDGIDFIFTNGTAIPPGGYLVVAQNPAQISTQFGVAALGPWTGKLRNSGERIALANASGEVVDEVTYQLGFPWPTVGEDPSPSIELIHPSLDNALGGSWRASGNRAGLPSSSDIFVAPAETGWLYFKGNPPPADDASARNWTYPDYDEGPAWLTGQTPIGYGDGDDNTVLGDMQNNYITFFARREFTIAPDTSIPPTLELGAYVDDGCIVWINGIEAHRFNAPEGAIPNPPPENWVGNNEAVWSTIPVSGGLLHHGRNVVAVQHINTVSNSSDASLDIELKVPGATSPSTEPTPGAPNNTSAIHGPPQLRQVGHAAANRILPRDKTIFPGEDVVITVKITDPEGVAGATLEYQTVDPGDYINLSDPRYQSGWIPLTMLDDGIGNDALGGDAVFSATIPAAANTHRRLIRYRILATDILSASVQAPYVDDPTPNFTYFVYGDIPTWIASDQPGTSSPKTYDFSQMEPAAVYHLITTPTDHADALFIPPSTRSSGYTG